MGKRNQTRQEVIFLRNPRTPTVNGNVTVNIKTLANPNYFVTMYKTRAKYFASLIFIATFVSASFCLCGWEYF